MRVRLGFDRSTAAFAASLIVSVALTALAAEDFGALVKRMQQEKPEFAKRQQALLEERYDLADRPAAGVTMSRGKPVQEGVRARLPKGTTWEKLAAMSPEEIKAGTFGRRDSSPCLTRITSRAAWSFRSR